MLLDDVLKELHGRHNTFILLEKEFISDLTGDWTIKTKVKRNTKFTF